MKDRLTESGLASHEVILKHVEKRAKEAITSLHLLATGLDPTYGPDWIIEQGQEKHHQMLTILRESCNKLDLDIGSVMQNWSDYQYKVIFRIVYAACFLNVMRLKSRT